MKFANMIMKEIKAHNKERGYLDDKNGSLKFVSMDIIEGKEAVKCFGGQTMTAYIVKCQFKAKEYEDNIVYYEVCFYTDGSMAIYFHGLSYEA